MELNNGGCRTHAALYVQYVLLHLFMVDTIVWTGRKSKTANKLPKKLSKGALLAEAEELAKTKQLLADDPAGQVGTFVQYKLKLVGLSPCDGWFCNE